MRNKKLVIYYGDLIHKDNSKYFCKPGLGRFIDEMSKYYNEILYCAPVINLTTNLKNSLYEIKSKNIDFQELSKGGSFISSIIHKRKIINEIKEYSKKWNSCDIYLRWPTPLTYNVYKIVKKTNSPKLLHIVGDTREIILSAGKYRGISKLLALLYINNEERQIKKIIKNNKTLVNGNGLSRLYKGMESNVEEIRSATLSTKEILFNKTSEKSFKKPNLIYVGVLKKEKGLIHLLESLSILKQYFNDIHLNIVGDGPEKENLKFYVENNSLSNNVTFHGYIPLGKELFDLYNSSNIFVLPSVSEGTPRVLIEAMAHGIPVIATQVGGVPFTISNGKNGILIKPEDSRSIFNAVKLIMEDNELRN